MNLKHAILLLHFLFLSFSASYAQSAETGRSIHVIDSLQKRLQQLNDDSNKVNVLNKLGVLLTDKENFSPAKEYVLQALKLSRQLGFESGEADAYSQLGHIEWFLGNSPESMTNYYAALKIEERLSRGRDIAFLYYGIGSKAHDIGNFSEARKNFELALKNYAIAKDTVNMGKANSALGDVLVAERKYAEALIEYNKALAIFEGRGKSPAWLGGMAHYGIADVNYALSEEKALSENRRMSAAEYQSILENYIAAREDFAASKALGSSALRYTNSAIGNLYVKLNELDGAKKIFVDNLEWARNTGDKKLSELSLYGLYSIDSSKKDYSNAFFHYKDYVLYRDSVNNLEGNKKIHQERLQYEYEKKEAISKAKQAEKDAETRRIRALQFASIGFFIVIAVLLYMYSRKEKKAKDKIENAYAQLKSAQAQLIQSEKMASLGELTAGIAHEIQNPLNFVNNFSDVNREMIDELNEEVDRGNWREVKIIAENIKENESKINHHGKRADAIVKGMLQHSRNSSGAKEPVDLNALCDEYLRLSYHGFRAKDKTFNAEIKMDFDPAIGSAGMVRQDIGRLMLNLFNNAFYSVAQKQRETKTAYSPKVDLQTKRQDQKVQITVRDNGNGISAEIRDKIFQPFFTTKPTGQGTGLGLSLSYDIVKAHGGEIKVESSEGEGTVFTVILPV